MKLSDLNIGDLFILGRNKNKYRKGKKVYNNGATTRRSIVTQLTGEQPYNLPQSLDGACAVESCQ